jgi:hypothetical protein
VVASDPEGPKKQEPLSRIEREVLEILEQSEANPPPVTDLMRWKAEQQRLQRQAQIRSIRDQIAERMTPGMLLIFGVLLAIMAYAARHTSAFVSRGFAIAALVCLILPFVMNWRKPGQMASGPKRWRGKDVVFDQPPANPIEEIKRWWRNRR